LHRTQNRHVGGNHHQSTSRTRRWTEAAAAGQSAQTKHEKVKNRSALIELCLAAVACLLALPALCGPVSGGDCYTEPKVYQMRPDPAREMALDCIGATGIFNMLGPQYVYIIEYSYLYSEGSKML
jgi:hypothetical protein